MAAIRLEHLSKRFDGPRVLEDLNLEIANGEFFTFLGPSGCGKSTLLNLIAGIQTPDAGSIRLGEREVTRLPPGERDVAMVFQSYALYPHMTVAQNLAFPLKVRKTPRYKIQGRVAEVARVMGLTDLLERRPAALSGGQRQRVALGRALIRWPAVFLMDEPLSNLDARLRLEMREEIKRLHGEHGITTVYVTHDQEEALALSDRIAVLEGGRVQQCAPPQQIYGDPDNLFVARFIGSPPMNVLPSAVLADVGLAWDGVLAGIRPADMAVSARCEGRCLHATVMLLEPTGSDLWVVGKWQGHRLKGRAVPGENLAPGMEACFALPGERLYLFDEASGKRLRPEGPNNGGTAR